MFNLVGIYRRIFSVSIKSEFTVKTITQQFSSAQWCDTRSGLNRDSRIRIALIPSVVLKHIPSSRMRYIFRNWMARPNRRLLSGCNRLVIHHSRRDQLTRIAKRADSRVCESLRSGTREITQEMFTHWIFIFPRYREPRQLSSGWTFD